MQHIWPNRSVRLASPMRHQAKVAHVASLQAGAAQARQPGVVAHSAWRPMHRRTAGPASQAAHASVEGRRSAHI